MVKILALNSKDAEVKSELRDIAIKIQKSRKIVAVTGAGISCDAGIPDFRSNDGLYNMVKHQYPNAVVKGKDLFDTVLFSNPTSIGVFFTFMSSLRKCIQKAHPTDTHKFLTRLKTKRKLLRCYTQNIDGLEDKVQLNVKYSSYDDSTMTSTEQQRLTIGLDPKEKPDVVQLHGDIFKLKCMHCDYQCEWSKEQEALCDKGEPPSCPQCSRVQFEREQKGKRNTGIGNLRPNIVLYGEEHPDGEMIGRCTASDLRSNPDCLMIMGTSLKVAGIRKLVREMAKAVKARGGIVIFVNATDTQSMWKNVIDYHIKGNCDDWVKSLKDTIPNFFSDQTTIKFKTKKLNQDAATKKIPSPPSTPKSATKCPSIYNETEIQMPLTPASREASVEEDDKPQTRSPLKNITNRIVTAAKRKLEDFKQSTSASYGTNSKRKRVAKPLSLPSSTSAT